MNADLHTRILDRLSRELADDIVKHRLTERDAHMIGANIAGEAILHAARIEEDRAKDLAAMDREVAAEKRMLALGGGAQVGLDPIRDPARSYIRDLGYDG